jgi:hypothetical protein
MANIPSGWIVIPTTGNYRVAAGIAYATLSGGYRGVFARINAGAAFLRLSMVAGPTTIQPAVTGYTIATFTVGDTIQLATIQGTGGALALAAVLDNNVAPSPLSGWLSVERIQ